jgi:phospholipid/cholesterol/gamma-HCH transport system ATP-binding protein
VTIQYRNVHKRFGEQVVLAGIELTVPQGERLAIVGPSGTGKSVLLKTTIGLICPDRGDVLIDDVSVVHGDRAQVEAVRRKAGYVFQNAALFDSLDVYENVAQGLSERELDELPPGEVHDRVVDALEAVNLDPARVLTRLPAELSGGMRKRVGLARAIIGRPEILLYDEPVTGLDPVMSASVNQLIERVSERLKATSLIVTHDVEGVLDICDRVALLNHGRLHFVGRADEFRSSDDPMVRSFADRHAAAEVARREAEARYSEDL